MLEVSCPVTSAAAAAAHKIKIEENKNPTVTAAAAAAQVKWAKLRGTPGSPPDKLAEAEHEVAAAEERLRGSKIAYEELVATMTEELNRWQKERAADMSALLRDFALAQVRNGLSCGFGLPHRLH